MNTMGRAGAGMGLLGFRIRFRVSCFLQGHSTPGQVHIFWDSGSPNRVYSLTFCPSEKYCKTIRLAENYEKKSCFLLKCFSASQQTPGLLNSSTGLQPHEKRGPPLAPVKIHRVLNIGSAAWPSLGWCFLPLSSDFVLIIFFALVLMKSLLGVLRFQVH